jgi:hypothetical protein
VDWVYTPVDMVRHLGALVRCAPTGYTRARTHESGAARDLRGAKACRDGLGREGWLRGAHRR